MRIPLANRTRSVPIPQPTSSSFCPLNPEKSTSFGEVVQLVEAVVVEIIEKRFRADRVVGHFEIVNTVVPVVGYRVDHKALSYNAFLQCSVTSAAWRIRSLT